MAALTIRKLSERTHDGLRLSAARNGRSMEAEARLTLDQKYADQDERSIDQYLADIDAAISRAYKGEQPTRTLADFLADRRETAARGE